MIIDRFSTFVDDELIPEQADFRAGKPCIGQILNLSHFIEDGFEDNAITDAAFLDLSAAYHTINHKKLVYLQNLRPN